MNITGSKISNRVGTIVETISESKGLTLMTLLTGSSTVTFAHEVTRQLSMGITDLAKAAALIALLPASATLMGMAGISKQYKLTRFLRSERYKLPLRLRS